MGTYTVVANADYRNEGWTLGGGVVSLTSAWNNDDDAKYASCPSNRGRAAVRFPVDISSANIPDGAVITSVTIKIRVRKTVSDSKSVTVNVLSTDNTARYTSRTLYPTTSFADYEVGTYTTDPVGKAWDKDRLNRLAVQVFSYSVPPNDGVRVAKLYAVVNYKSRPTVTITAPSGTVTSPSPTVTWSYSQTDGDLQKSAEYKVFTAAQVAAATFNPDTSTAAYIGSVTGDITSFTLPTALTPDNYYIYVRVTSVFDSKSAWTSRSFTVSGAAPGVPGGGIGGIGTGGGGGFESVISDSETSNAFLTLRDGSNLLSVQQASFETDTDSLGYTSTNCTLSYDTTEFYQGVGSMKMSSTASGDMKATSSFIEVAGSTALTARCQVKAAANARTVNLWILFYDETFTYLGAYSASGTAVDSTSTYTEIVANATSPAAADTTLYAQVQIEVKATGGAAEVHNVDQVGLMYGVNSQWSHGGHMSRNLLSSAASDGDDPITVNPWSAASAATTVSRVTSSGTGAEGSKMYQMSYTGTSPTVAYQTTGTADSQTSSGTGFTLNKPTGVADGDLLVAYVAADAGVVTQANAPSGWTVVASSDSGSGSAATLSVLMRDGLAADPATWVGNLSSSGTRRRAVVLRYSGAAATSAQLLTQAIVSSVSGSLTPTTPSLSNSVSGAFRLSAFAVRDDTATSGSSTANQNPPSTPPAISYVGKGANWWYGGSTGSYQVNKPSGLAQNDLILAFASFSGTATPATPGAGWTQIRRITKTTGNGDDHSGSATFVIWRKIAGASEPSSWSSTYTGTGTPLMTQCVAYRNVDTTNPIIDEDFGSSFGNDLDTNTVTNTDSKAWRVSAFTFTTNYGESTSSNEVSERADNKTDVGAHPDIQIGVYDSNGPVSTGSHTRWGSVTSGNSAWAGIGWIGLLKPTSSVSPGANENERADGGTFSGSAGIHLAAYDNTAGIGSQRVYESYTPSSGTSINASVAWQGFLLPAAPTVSGEVGAVLTTPVDISAVAQAVIDRSGGKVTAQAAFLGSTAGAPYLKVYFYNGNELIATRIAEGIAFNTTTWVKSAATFDIPAGTTRIGMGVAASDREVGDNVWYDRVSVAFGEATVWRRGTGRTEHPIFNVPALEYAEDTGDGYGDWKSLGGSDKALLRYDQLTGLVTFVDQMLTPLAKRKYRAKTLSYGLAGDVFASGYGDESTEISLTAQEWWLKDPTDPDLAQKLIVKSGGLGVTTASTAAVFQALGADRPVVLTEGYKGDTFSIDVRCSRLQYAALRRMLNSRKTLFLQTNLDAAWWVRPIGDIGAEYLETWDRHENPIRWVKLTFTEVDPE
jgi:hypothetical protein